MWHAVPSLTIAARSTSKPEEGRSIWPPFRRRRYLYDPPRLYGRQSKNRLLDNGRAKRQKRCTGTAGSQYLARSVGLSVIKFLAALALPVVLLSSAIVLAEWAGETTPTTAATRQAPG